MWDLGVVGGKTKNASCSEPGDENVSCSELRGLQPPGFDCPICTTSCSSRARTRPDKPFPTTSERYPTRFAQLAMGCSNPALRVGLQINRLAIVD